MSFLDFLSPLLYDPTAAGGGFLAQLAGVKPPAGAPSPSASMTAPFASTSILGNSPIVNLIRNGFVGMSGANGYSGLSAVGAGARSASEYDQRRQAFLQNNLFANQQYKAGQTAQAGANLDLGDKLRSYNIWDRMVNPNHVDLTPDDLQDPQKLAKVMSFNPGASSSGGNDGTQPMPVGQDGVARPYAQPPQLDGSVNPMAAPPAAGAPVPTTPPGAAAAAPQAGAAAPAAPDAMTTEFMRLHAGMTPFQWAQLGMSMRNTDMVKEAEQYDPALITGQALAKTAGTVLDGRSGSLPINAGTGQPIGDGAPSLTDMPLSTGGTFKALVYPSGKVVRVGDGAVLSPGTGGTAGGSATAPGASPTTAGAGAPSDGAVVGQTLTPYMQQRQQDWAKSMSEWGQGVQGSYVAEQRALAIADALKATTSGAFATQKADIAAKLKAVGINLSPDVWGDPAKVQQALKDNFQASLEQIRQFTSRPAAAELTLAQQNFANPNLQPEANLAIIGQIVGTLRWNRDAYAAAQKALDKTPGDPDAFANDWAQQHPIQGYVDRTVKDIGPLMGMPGGPKAENPAPEGTVITNQQGQKLVKQGGKWVPVQ